MNYRRSHEQQRAKLPEALHAAKKGSLLLKGSNIN